MVTHSGKRQATNKKQEQASSPGRTERQDTRQDRDRERIGRQA